ncbi:MAG: hypothetical protein ABSF35_05530 [Polyangia bacterium]|jgi:hypothetical protein
MDRFFGVFSVVLLLLGCGHTGPEAARPAPSPEEVLERGGELANADAVRAKVLVTADRVSVWGMTEVPDGSRMQMALAGVDAITRSELLKSIEVRVSGVVTSVESTDPSRRSVVVESVEAVSGALSETGPLPHGWARVRRGDKVVLRLWARLDVARIVLESAIRAAVARAGQGDASAIIGGLATPPMEALGR